MQVDLSAVSKSETVSECLFAITFTLISGKLLIISFGAFLAGNQLIPGTNRDGCRHIYDNYDRIIVGVGVKIECHCVSLYGRIYSMCYGSVMF